MTFLGVFRAWRNHNCGLGSRWEPRLEPLLAGDSGLESKRRNEIEIAAEDEVVYQDVITAMDYSISEQFAAIGYLDPSSLSVRFRE